MDTYYYVPSKQYIYKENNNWVWRNSLPAKYKGHDMYNSYKVVMNTKKPYLNHGNNVSKYASYKNKKGAQSSLRDYRGDATPQKKVTARKAVTSHRTVKTTVKTSSAHNHSNGNANNNGQKNNKNGNQGKK